MKRLQELLIVEVSATCPDAAAASDCVIAAGEKHGYMATLDVIVESMGLLPPEPPAALASGNLWGLEAVGLPVGPEDPRGAWSRTHGNRAVKVCIIDSGIDYFHPSLKANAWRNPGEIPDNGIDDDNNGFVDDYRGYSFVDGIQHHDPMDDAFHGTHLAGIVGGYIADLSSHLGVSPMVSLIACKFLGSDLRGVVSDALLCLDYCLSVDAHITLNSYGGEFRSPVFEAAIAEAQQQQQLFVTAAGNYGMNLTLSPLYPASFNQDIILAVGASDQQDVLVDAFSNFGEHVDLVAPGVDIVSTSTPELYRAVNGTSQSAAFVAGAAALLLAAYADMGYNISGQGLLLKQLILASVDAQPQLRDKCLTGGRLNVTRAMELVPSQKHLQHDNLTEAATQLALPTLLPDALFKHASSTDLESAAKVSGTQPPSPPDDGALLVASAVVAEKDSFCQYAVLGLGPKCGQLPCSSVTVQMQPAGKQGAGWEVCSRGGEEPLPSPSMHGVDIRAQLVDNGRATVRLNGSLEWGGHYIYQMDVLADGSVRPFVPAPAPDDAGGSDYADYAEGGLAFELEGGLRRSSRRLRTRSSTCSRSLEDGSREAAAGSFRITCASNAGLREARPDRSLGTSAISGGRSTDSWVAALEEGPLLVPLGLPFTLTNCSQVLLYERGGSRPRVVLSWLNVAFADVAAPGSFQVEIFSGKQGRPGAVRVTAIHPPPRASAVVGISEGAGSAARCRQLPAEAIPQCRRAAAVAVQPTNLSLAAAAADGAGSWTAGRQPLALSNPSERELPVSISISPQVSNALRCDLWLNEVTDYNSTFAVNASTCPQASARSDPLCAWFQHDAGTASFLGRHTPARPPRFVRELQLPLWIRAVSERRSLCDNHFLLLSSSPQPGRFSGQEGTVKLALGCMDKVLHVHRGGGFARGCGEYGETHWNVLLDQEHVWFFTGSCPLLKAKHGLPVERVFLFFGADCAPSRCPAGGAVWKRLQVLPGLQQPPAAAEAAAQAAATPTAAGHAGEHAGRRAMLRASVVGEPAPAAAGRRGSASAPRDAAAHDRRRVSTDGAEHSRPPPQLAVADSGQHRRPAACSGAGTGCSVDRQAAAAAAARRLKAEEAEAAMDEGIHYPSWKLLEHVFGDAVPKLDWLRLQLPEGSGLRREGQDVVGSLRPTSSSAFRILLNGSALPPNETSAADIVVQSTTPGLSEATFIPVRVLAAAAGP